MALTKMKVIIVGRDDFDVAKSDPDGRFVFVAMVIIRNVVVVPRVVFRMGATFGIHRLRYSRFIDHYEVDDEDVIRCFL